MGVVTEIGNYFHTLKEKDPDSFKKRRAHGERLFDLISKASAENLTKDSELIRHIEKGINDYKKLFGSERYATHLKKMLEQLDPTQGKVNLENTLQKMRDEAKNIRFVVQEESAKAEVSTDIALEDKPLTPPDKLAPESFGYLLIDNFPVGETLSTKKDFTIFSKTDLNRKEIFNDPEVKKFVDMLELEGGKYFPSFKDAYTKQAYMRMAERGKSNVILAIPKTILDNPIVKVVKEEDESYKKRIFKFGLNDVATIYFNSEEKFVVNPNFDWSQLKLEEGKKPEGPKGR